MPHTALIMLAKSETFRNMREQTSPSSQRKEGDSGTTPTNRAKLTDRLVRGLEPGPDGIRVVRDTEQKGLAVRVFHNGLKTFVISYTVHGRKRVMKIGSYPDWTVLAARKQCTEYRRRIDMGDDPLEVRSTLRKAPTVREMAERYLRDHLPRLRASSQRNYEASIVGTILPALGAKKVSELTFDDCEALHRRASRSAPTSANRHIAVLRRMLNLAMQWGWIDKNPASGIEMNAEVKRDRYLNREEMSRLKDALATHPQQDSCDAIRFMIYTGCRRGEALGAKWDQFSDDLRTWTKSASSTKQKRVHRVPVFEGAVEILRIRKREASSEWVFPSRGGQPLAEVKRTWQRVREVAGIPDVRLHDLRHTWASIAVSKGLSLPMIGAMLGHSQTQTTARYAHLFDDPLREAASLVGEEIGH